MLDSLIYLHFIYILSIITNMIFMHSKTNYARYARRDVRYVCGGILSCHHPSIRHHQSPIAHYVHHPLSLFSPLRSRPILSPLRRAQSWRRGTAPRSSSATARTRARCTAVQQRRPRSSPARPTRKPHRPSKTITLYCTAVWNLTGCLHTTI